MKSGSTGRLRLTLLAAGLIPVVVAGVAAAVAADAAVPLLAAGVVGGGMTAGLVHLATRRLTALAADCDRVLGGSAPDAADDGTDEVGTIAKALRELEARRAAAVTAYRRTLKGLAAGAGRLADGGAAPEPAPDDHCPAEFEQLGAATRDLNKKVAAVRQRLAVATRVLQQLPTPLAAVDDRGRVRFVNAPAEQLFGRPSAAVAGRTEFRALLGEPSPDPDPLGRPVLGPGDLADWLKRGAAGEAVLTAARPDGRTARVGATAVRLAGADGDGMWYLLARDLTDEYVRVGADRGRVRGEALRAGWGWSARATDPVDAILAAARLLAADAKQSGHRDTLLPKVAAVRDQASDVEAHVRSARWLAGALWGEFPAPDRTEFPAADPALAAVGQLAPRLKARNVTVTVADHGGWVCGDEEWVRTALLGVLAHAGEAVRDATVGLHVRRLPPAAGEVEDRVAFEVLDAGPPLSAAQLRDLDAPFGALSPPSYLDPAAPPGFLPGLILARALAAEMGGELAVGTTPGGGLVVRLVVPALVPGAGPVERADPGDGAPVEELVLGWKLGAA